MKMIEKKNILVQAVSELKNVMSIGQTGDMNEILVPGKSDIDLFVLCDEVPGYETRKAVYDRHGELFATCQMEVCKGGIWGTGDILLVDGIETMFMYFTIEEMNQYIEEVLLGKHMEGEYGFYPIGRLATINQMNILYEEDGSFTLLKKKVEQYPDALSKKTFEYHVNRIIDEEDFGRVESRKEVLFYHKVLERSLDHYLQALFALNKVYFPSRKRTKQYLEGFGVKPVNCYERILDVVRKSTVEETVVESCEEWMRLVEELKERGLYNGE